MKTVRTSLPIRRSFALLVLSLVVQGQLTAGAEMAYRDDFESATLNSFWSRREASGSITFPATARAYAGRQSVQLDSTAGTGQKNIDLFHTFPAPIYGRASVWVYDSGADEFSANYLGFFLRNQEAQTTAGIFTQDYDLGPSNGGNYYFNAPDRDSVLTAIDRTKAWHQFIITATAEVLQLEVDGTIVFNGAGGFSFDYVTMEIHGPTWRPAWSVQFDDFELVEYHRPIICSQPGSITVSPGADATFATVATGAEPLSYQWRFNGLDIAGETKSTLHLADVGVVQAGTYSVQVANALGVTNSIPATLTVFGAEMLPGITIAGPSGASYRIEYTESIGNPGGWRVLGNFTLTASPYRLVDWSASGHARRFYRAILVP